MNIPTAPTTFFSISACADERPRRRRHRSILVLAKSEDTQPTLASSAADQPNEMQGGAAEQAASENPYRRYRRQTFGILRRYLYCCTQIGRAPNIFGRENQNTGKNDQPSYTFEDEVIFALDIERALQRLRPHSLQALSLVVLEENTMEEAAALLGWGRMTIFRIFPEALDEFSEVLLRLQLLQPAPGHDIGKFLVKGSNRIQ